MSFGQEIANLSLQLYKLDTMYAYKSRYHGSRGNVVLGFPLKKGEDFVKFWTLVKLRSVSDFGHTTNAKLIPCEDSSVTKPTLRLLNSFDELFVNFQGVCYFKWKQKWEAVISSSFERANMSVGASFFVRTAEDLSADVVTLPSPPSRPLIVFLSREDNGSPFRSFR